MEKEKNKNMNTAAVAEAQRELYEGSVVQRMSGRCGVTPKGAKGIAHEIMDIDKQNIKDVLNPNRVTQMTKNPHATQLDAVTMDHGKVVQRIQYKDTVSTGGLNKTLNQVGSGKYNQATLKGTKETTELFNAKASRRGINKTMESTGISTKDTTRVADKYLAVNKGSIPANVGANLCTAAKSSALGAAGFTAVIEAGKGIWNGDDPGTTANNIVAKSSESAVSGLAAGAVGEAAFIGTALVCPPLAVPAAIVGGLVTGTVVGEAVEGVFDGVGDVAEEVVDGFVSVAGDIATGVSDFAEDLKDGISDVFDGIFGGWFW